MSIAFRRPSSWRAALIGAIVAALVTLPGLGVGTLWDNSETVYGEVAREILLYGDPVVMHLNAAPWFVQPPLYFWLAAWSAKAFGLSAFALRLPSALATVGMGAVAGLCAGRLVSLRAALFGSVILSTSLLQAVVGRLAIMDALLDFSVTLAIVSAYAALHTGRDRYWYGAWTAAALGFLAKGPVALLIPVLVVAGWAWWEHRVGGTLIMPRLRVWVLGLLLFVVIAAPWIVLAVRAAGSVALDELVGHYSVGRYLGAIENQSGPVWYYVPVVILGFFPWVAFLIPAMAAAWRNVRAVDQHLVRLCLVWSVVPFVFFSFAQTKLPNYIALEVPALALLVALWFDGVVDREDRRATLAWTALVPVTIAIVGVAIFIFSKINRLSADLHTILGDVAWLGLTTLAGSIACSGLLGSRRTAPLAPFALGAASLGSMLIIALVAEPHAERFKPIPPLAAVVNEQRRPNDLVAIWNVSGTYALLFYTRPRIERLDSPDTPAPHLDARETICNAARAFVVTARVPAAPVPTYGRRRREVARAGSDVLYLYDGPRCAARTRTR